MISFLQLGEAAASGLIIVALQISYLPTMYSAYNRRETEVTLLRPRAGSPAWGPELLARAQLASGVEQLTPLYASWERWAADVAESHSSYPVLLRFRSPEPHSSWIISQLAVLDAAAVQRIARDHGLDWPNPDDIRRIIVPAAGGPATHEPQTLEVLTYARDLMMGEVVRPEDLTFAKTPAIRAPIDAPSDAQEVIGKAARRPLRSGTPVAAHDVGPELRIRALLAGGECRDLNGERQLAVADYQAAIDTGPNTNRADIARKHLRTPYKGN